MDLEGAARRPYSRRAFLVGALSTTAAGVLAACSQPAPTPEQHPPRRPPNPRPHPPAPRAHRPRRLPQAHRHRRVHPGRIARRRGIASSKSSSDPELPARPLRHRLPPRPRLQSRAPMCRRSRGDRGRRKAIRGQKVVFYGDGVGPTGITEGAGAMKFPRTRTSRSSSFSGRRTAPRRWRCFKRFFQGQSSDIDAFSVDVAWPGVLAPHLVDLSQQLGDEAKHLPGIIQNNTVNGKLVAMTDFLHFGMLELPHRPAGQQQSQGSRDLDDLQTASMTILNGEKADEPELRWLCFPGSNEIYFFSG